MSDSNAPAQSVQDGASIVQPANDSGNVQVQDASPQVPTSEPAKIPEVKHDSTSDAPASKESSNESKKEYPGGEKFDPTALPKSDDAAEIRKQVEFYFSDSNLSTDKFLFTMVSENEGWADLRTVANFKRMRRFQPFTAVVEALRSSTELDLNEGGEKVKRKRELKPFTAANAPVDRSIYAKGFPEETKTLQIELEKYFDTFGHINVVRLRRTDDGLFKGSVFVEFATLDEKEAFLKQGSGPEKLKFGETDIEVMSKKAYLDMKTQQYGGKFPTSSNKRTFNAFAKDHGKKGGTGGNRDRNSGRGRGGRGNGRGGRGGNRNEERRRENAAGGEEATASRGEKRPAEESHEVTTESATKVAKTE